MLGDMVVRFPQNKTSGRVGLEIIPAAALNQAVPRRATLRGLPFIDAMPGNDQWSASVVESLVQFKLIGDAYPGAFAQGHTMRNSESLNAFKFSGQEVLKKNATAIVTKFARANSCLVEHNLISRNADNAFEVVSKFFNGSKNPVTLEMFGSFSLSGITPFARASFSFRLERGRKARNAVVLP